MNTFEHENLSAGIQRTASLSHYQLERSVLYSLCSRYDRGISVFAELNAFNFHNASIIINFMILPSVA